ncbi:hypothetical protein DSO57_1030848 [Entomophthora muscae]|uniref:Uncharacterized protein n=1 Tax=Entomophthora muscae TaxID=34485 RepID=A0ACC2RRQ8_9FUNG|nr:hypothetical protein DSO57_1030848 [Entomophthora muscae]
MLTLFLPRLRRPLFDFLALALRIYTIGPTILSLKLLPCHLQRPPHYFALVVTLKRCPLHLFVQAVKDNNPQLHLPFAASVAHFMWYPPEVCSSGAVGFAGCCLEHFCGLAYQSKLYFPACYSYMKDVLLNCLYIGSAFSACGGWGCLVSEGNICLPLCGWISMSRNSQLAWCQMLMALAFVCKQMDNNKYKLVAPLVPLSVLKRPHSTPNCRSIPHLPADNVPSTSTSS